MSRRLVLVLALVAVVAAAAVGWAVGSRIKSPAQIAAEAEPPEASLITVPVARMVIANDVVTRGTVRFDEPEAVLAPQLAVPELSPVVTWVPAVGDELEEGSVLFELAGRPTFALQGDLPLFRTVRPGDRGEQPGLDVGRSRVAAAARAAEAQFELPDITGLDTDGGFEPAEP